MPEQLTNLWSVVTGNPWILFVLKVALVIAVGFAVQLGVVLLHLLLTRELARWLCGYLGLTLMTVAPIPAVFIGGWWWFLPPFALVIIALYTRVDYRDGGSRTTWIEVSGSFKWKRLGQDELKGRPEVSAAADFLVHDRNLKPGTEAVAKGDFETAHRMFEAFAEGGNVAAMNNLGVLYEAGLGVPADEAAALKWYRKAADSGVPLAKHNLAVLIAADHILGTAKHTDSREHDLIEAYVLLSSAAAQGLKAAKRGLRDLRRHMTRAQIAAAKSL